MKTTAIEALQIMAKISQAGLIYAIQQHKVEHLILLISPFEPCHEIMILFVLHKLILQTRMRSHPVGLVSDFFGWILSLLPYLMSVNSEGSGETVRIGRLA